MQGTREIRRRIRSVKNTQQITRAMKMVAAAKLRRTQAKVIAARPYMNKIVEVIASVCAKASEFSNPLLEPGIGGRPVLLVISADRGLCGGYNSNHLRLATDFAKEHGINDIIPVGRKARDHFKKRGYNIVAEHVQIPDYPDFALAKRICDPLKQGFMSGEFSNVYIVYTQFKSTMSQMPVCETLLPVDAPGADSCEGTSVEFIFEPDAAAVLDVLLPKYVDTFVFQALLESKASEFGAKMTAMSAATDNAGEMIDWLTLTYNRARQAAITKEITEIVGGANALK